MVEVCVARPRRCGGQLLPGEGLSVHEHHIGAAARLLHDRRRHAHLSRGTSGNRLCAACVVCLPVLIGRSPVVSCLQLLNTRYNRRHLLGAGLCVIGLGLLVASDILQERYKTDGDAAAAPAGSQLLIGDLLVLCGCVCYGISNIGQELVVKHFDRTEFLAMIGLFGTIISGVQVAVFERDALASVPLDGE